MDKRVKVLSFAIGSAKSSSVSGGAVRFMETVKRLPRDWQIILVGTSGSKAMLIHENIKRKYKFILLKNFIFKKAKQGKLTRLLHYFYATFQAIFLIPGLVKVNLVYSAAHFFWDIIPAFFYVLIKNSKWVVMVHHLCPPPWERKGNIISNTFSFFDQRLSFILIGLKADLVFIYDTPMGEKVKKAVFKLSFRQIKFKKVINAVDLSSIKKALFEKNIYEACFVGGLRETKGIFDAIKIWQQVCQKLPLAKLVVVGDGTKDVEIKVKREIKKHGLKKNINLLGYLDRQKELYSIIKSSQILISPSHEEGWGIAVYEALACGLPVIAYDLPNFKKDLSPALNLIAFKNIASFVNKTLSLLSQKDKYKLAQDSIKTKLHFYHWDQAIAKDMIALKKLI